MATSLVTARSALLETEQQWTWPQRSGQFLELGHVTAPSRGFANARFLLGIGPDESSRGPVSGTLRRRSTGAEQPIERQFAASNVHVEFRTPSRQDVRWLCSRKILSRRIMSAAQLRRHRRHTEPMPKNAFACWSSRCHGSAAGQQSGRESFGNKQANRCSATLRSKLRDNVET
jgi:hypothetical protein